MIANLRDALGFSLSLRLAFLVALGVRRRVETGGWKGGART